MSKPARQQVQIPTHLYLVHLEFESYLCSLASIRVEMIHSMAILLSLIARSSAIT